MGVQEADNLKKVLPRPVLGLNRILPKHLPVVGPNTDNYAIKEWIQQLTDVAREYGAKTITLGSGSARRIPSAFPKGRAEEQLAWFVLELAELASTVGASVCLEPLREKETNLINTIDEALEFISGYCSSQPVYITVDPIHVYFGAVDFGLNDDLVQLIRHVHISDVERRPISWKSSLPRAFLFSLMKYGYTGAISLECSWSDSLREIAVASDITRYWLRISQEDETT